MPEIFMVCTSPLIVIILLPRINKFPFGSTESTRALSVAVMDPCVEVEPAPVNVLPVVTPPVRLSSVLLALVPVPAKERLLLREVDVLALLEALEFSVT